jgi:hypothetical protein
MPDPDRHHIRSRWRCRACSCAAPFFAMAGAVVAVAILGALSQADFRDFWTAEPPEAKMTIEPA